MFKRGARPLGVVELDPVFDDLSRLETVLKLGERRDPIGTRELAALIPVHNLRRVAFGEGFIQGFNAEAGMHGGSASARPRCGG